MTLRKIAEIEFPTRRADFRLLAFARALSESHSETALALVLGNIHGAPPIVRIHSQCITGDVFHSLRCDCHDQLHLALEMIANEGAGVLIYEQQEGRGIGLLEKLKAYELQERGLDTVEANLRLGHKADQRDYALPVEILHYFAIRSVRALTNNPEKLNALCVAGIEVVERLCADVPENPHSAFYLWTKREKLGHFAADRTFDTARTSSLALSINK